VGPMGLSESIDIGVIGPRGTGISYGDRRPSLNADFRSDKICESMACSSSSDCTPPGGSAPLIAGRLQDLKEVKLPAS